MAVNWALGYQQGPNIGQQFQQSYEAGTQRRRQQELQNALRGVATNPNDPNAVNAYIAVDPVGGMQFRQQQAQAQQQASERQRESIRLGARIVRQLNVRDEAGWQQARQIAQQAGVDLSQVPQNFDPQYVQGLLAAGQAMETQQGGDGFTLGEGQVRYSSDGRQIAAGPAPRPRYYPLAPGGRLELDPAYQGGAPQPVQPQGAIPTVSTPEQAAALPPGTQFRDPQGNIRTVPGGPTPQASGNFPGN